PSGGVDSGGHHGVDSSKVLPITPSNRLVGTTPPLVSVAVGTLAFAHGRDAGRAVGPPTLAGPAGRARNGRGTRRLRRPVGPVDRGRRLPGRLHDRLRGLGQPARAARHR